MDNDKQIFIKGIEVASKEYAQSSFEAAKQYADDKDLILKDELEEEIGQVSNQFFDGNIEEWEELTPAEQQSYLFASVEGYVNLTVANRTSLANILGDDTEIISNMYDDEAETQLNRIAEGDNE